MLLIHTENVDVNLPRVSEQFDVYHVCPLIPPESPSSAPFDGRTFRKLVKSRNPPLCDVTKGSDTPLTWSLLGQC